MRKIRILLANHPRMVRLLVREMMERQSDMEVVGEVLDPLDVISATQEAEADVVVITINNNEAQELRRHLLAQCPNIVILALSLSGGIAFIEQLRPQRREMVDPSEVTILHALRQAVQALDDTEEGQTNADN
jgi:DNA-binding NarL/FixJ family response regulator